MSISQSSLAPGFQVRKRSTDLRPNLFNSRSHLSPRTTRCHALHVVVWPASVFVGGHVPSLLVAEMFHDVTGCKIE